MLSASRKTTKSEPFGKLKVPRLLKGLGLPKWKQRGRFHLDTKKGSSKENLPQSAPGECSTLTATHPLGTGLVKQPPDGKRSKQRDDHGETVGERPWLKRNPHRCYTQNPHLWKQPLGHPSLLRRELSASLVPSNQLGAGGKDQIQKPARGCAHRMCLKGSQRKEQKDCCPWRVATSSP